MGYFFSFTSSSNDSLLEVGYEGDINDRVLKGDIRQKLNDLRYRSSSTKKKKSSGTSSSASSNQVVS